jgi:hypothetical protein
VSFVWIKRNQFTLHLPVSLYTCGIVDSYHVNTSIVNGEHGSMVQLKIVLEMIKNINILFGKPLKGKKRKKNEMAPKDFPFKK